MYKSISNSYIIQVDGSVHGVGGNTHRSGDRFTVWIFQVFSQFYTPQSLGIHLVSYCYSPRFKPESKRLAVNEPGKIYYHIRSLGSGVIKEEVQGGVWRRQWGPSLVHCLSNSCGRKKGLKVQAFSWACRFAYYQTCFFPLVTNFEPLLYPPTQTKSC